MIDDQNKHLGAMDLSRALAIALERGLDLVEVGPTANPPVCKILDFGAFVFRQEKQERKAKAAQKKVDIKGIRLSFRIGEHDRLMRKDQSLKFLGQGHKVMLEIRLRGRENAHKDLAAQNMQTFIKDLGPEIAIEQPISRLGNRITAIVGRKK